jgi:putative SOS response-associated peptidase YedK
MAFAGIWASRLDPDTNEWQRTCSILTMEARGPIASIHDRMPVSLAPEVWDAWLDRDLRDPEAIRSLIQPSDPDGVMEHVVSRKVNTVKNNGPELHKRVEPETLF